MIGRTNVGGGGNTFAFIVVTYPEESDCTCSDGTRTIRAKGTTGSFVFNIPYAATWTVSCKKGEQTSDPVAVIITTAGQREEVELSYDVIGYVVYYDCEEITGTTVTDKSGNFNNATKYGNGAVVAVPGINGDGNGNALSITAGSARLEFTNSVFIAEHPFSISVWFKFLNNNNNQFHICNTSLTKSGNNGIQLLLNSKEITFCQVVNSSQIAACTKRSLVYDTWYHIVAVSDNVVGGKNTLYVDGAKVGESELTSVFPSHSFTATIGKVSDSAASMLSGAIDGYRIYNKALTSAEVRRLYSQRRG